MAPETCSAWQGAVAPELCSAQPCIVIEVGTMGRQGERPQAGFAKTIFFPRRARNGWVEGIRGFEPLRWHKLGATAYQNSCRNS
jgi:hypothetical protein